MNLSRGKPIKLTSSNRIASLIGNGIYTFIDSGTQYNSIFNENEVGKVLIEKDYPFALIKYLDENFKGKIDFNTKDALIIIKKPEWIRNN